MANNDTKACTISEDEVEALIHYHARQSVFTDLETAIDRLNYLNKRLKAFKEPEEKAPETKPEATEQKPIPPEAPTNPNKW